jgi:DNA-binding CsgD family transcriptional regulator
MGAKRNGAELTTSERLLALLYAKGLEPAEAAARLSAAGLTNSEIGSVLGKTGNAVKLLLRRSKKRAG